MNKPLTVGNIEKDQKNSMAKRKRNNKKASNEEAEGTNKAGSIAIILIIAVVAILAWTIIGMKKPDTTVDNPVQLPSYAYVSARSEQSYRAAMDPIITNGDAFSMIPCYCGCVGVGHSSLKDCFLDDHGSFCDVCQYEALETYDMVKQGVPMAQIRATIDQRYGGGRLGPGTNTPQVA